MYLLAQVYSSYFVLDNRICQRRTPGITRVWQEELDKKHRCRLINVIIISRLLQNGTDARIFPSSLPAVDTKKDNLHRFTDKLSKSER